MRGDFWVKGEQALRGADVIGSTVEGQTGQVI
jgi:hypothetical protein